MCDRLHHPILSLPEEILVYLFKFLTFDDRKNAALVCQDWCRILQFPVFARKTVLKLTSCKISRGLHPWKFLSQSKTRFYNVEIAKHLKFDSGENLDEFWERVGRDAESLSVYKFELLPNFGKTFFRFFPKLKEVSTENILTILEWDLTSPIESIHVKKVPFLISEENLNKFSKLTSLKILTAEFIDIQLNSELDFIFVHLAKNLSDFEKVKNKEFNLPIYSELNLIRAGYVEMRHVKWWPAFIIEPTDLATYSRDVFSNLHQVTLKCLEDGCFFVHEALPLLSWTKVLIDFDFVEVSYCSKCSEVFAQSCPNIKDVSFNYELPDVQDFLDSFPTSLTHLDISVGPIGSSLRLNQPFLRTFKLAIVGVGNWPKPPVLVSANWSPMLDLSRLEIRALKLFLTQSNLQELIAKTPTVKRVHLNFLISTDLVKDIEVGWKRLEYLLIRNGNPCDVVNSIQGSFHKLKVLRDNDLSIHDGKIKYYHVRAFLKVNSLRLAFGKTYDEFSAWVQSHQITSNK